MCLIQLANLLVIPQRKAQNLNNPQNTSFPILCCLKGSVTSVMEFSKLIENYCGLLSIVCGQKKGNRCTFYMATILPSIQNLRMSFQSRVFQKFELSEKKVVFSY